MSGTDYFVRMGASHSICQDYAIAGRTDSGRAYAILSDGCSGTTLPGRPGSPYTDFGARFLVRAARGEIERETFDPLSVAQKSHAALRALDLPNEAGDATLVVASEDGENLVVRMYGDGVIAARTREGVISYTTLEFENNSPYYLSYLTHPGRLAIFQHVCRTVTTTHRRRVDGVWEAPLVEANAILDVEARRHYPKANYDLVLIASDGLKSFTSASGEVPIEDVLDQVFTFKNLNGEFLTRRMKFFERHCREQGWNHYDDLSIAGMVLDAPDQS